MDVVESRQPDIIVLCEYNIYWRKGLARLEAEYPYLATMPGLGIAIYSRLEIERTSAMVRTRRWKPSWNFMGTNLPLSAPTRLHRSRSGGQFGETDN